MKTMTFGGAMKNIFLMLLMIASLFNATALYAHDNQTSNQQNLISMESMNCHEDGESNMNHVNMEKSDCNMVGDDMNCEDCLDCNVHCNSQSISLIDLSFENSLNFENEVFNHKLNSLKISKQINNLFRPPIA